MKMGMRLRRAGAALAIFCVAVVCSGAAREKYFEKWPGGAAPAEIGRKVALRFADGPHTNFGRPTPPAHITYPETVAWYGALTFAQAAGDKELSAILLKRFEPLLGNESGLVPAPVNVDSTIFGAVPLELYMETKDRKYLEMGLRFADAQWERATPEGLTPQTRYWIDDMYMITLVQVQAYRATGEEKYIDRAATEMVAYLNKLQQPNGLFFHAPDAPFFWGRGNGWVAAGMAEILRSLPRNHAARKRIMKSYRKMMAALLRYQGADGLWRQLLDHPEAWAETSCSAMFTFAMISGVREGWLDGKKYGPAARKGWLGLVSEMEPDGDLRNVCEGTNKKDDVNYYLNRARITGDLHGQAPLLWCATALLR